MNSPTVSRRTRERGGKHAPRLVDLLPVLRARGVAHGVADHDDRVHRRALRVPRRDGRAPREDDHERRDARHCALSASFVQVNRGGGRTGDPVAEEQADAVVGQRAHEDGAEDRDAVREERGVRAAVLPVRRRGHGAEDDDDCSGIPISVPLSHA